MSALAPGDKVLFHQGPGYVGIIAAPNGGGWSVNFNPGSGDAWLIVSSLTKLPDNTPIFRTGTTVQVRCNAPYHAGRRGKTCGAEIRGDLFGYLLQLDDTAEPVWVPAAVLFAVETPAAHEGGGRR